MFCLPEEECRSLIDFGNGMHRFMRGKFTEMCGPCGNGSDDFRWICIARYLQDFVGRSGLHDMILVRVSIPSCGRWFWSFGANDSASGLRATDGTGKCTLRLRRKNAYSRARDILH